MSRRQIWSKVADDLLKSLVDESQDSETWDRIAEQMTTQGLKYNKKQCRCRWINVVSPSLKFGAWTKEEEEVLFSAWGRLGNQWMAISDLLPGRSENQIKNRFYSTMRRIMRRKQKLFPHIGVYFKSVKEIIKDKQIVLELFSESTEGIYRKNRYKGDSEQLENYQTLFGTIGIEDLEVSSPNCPDSTDNDCFYPTEDPHIDSNLIVDQIINEFK